MRSPWSEHRKRKALAHGLSSLRQAPRGQRKIPDTSPLVPEPQPAALAFQVSFGFPFSKSEAKQVSVSWISARMT